ncbi:deoxycytidylate deaminase-like [Dendronephthya gigantea]|uniref:deoxycytidylate deaminase-like n=1 Tax=Dendronephthya gigantea TaxID=151771 RepID=UPI00106A1A1D|nr:deoxycytidylate deaminase-like [Dendronephthya gigantea]
MAANGVEHERTKDNSGNEDDNPKRYAPKCDQIKKRDDYLEWEEYFMAVAFLSAQRSKDPNSQVGACIVNEEKKIVGIGYNGMPNGCSDDLLPWARKADDDLDTKYPYVCHAEMNAILNKNSSTVKGCTIFVALFPCNECAKLIIQSGINKIVYLSDKYHNQPNMKASRTLLNMAKVEYVKFEPKRKTILVDFTSMDQSFLLVSPQKQSKLNQ